MMRLGAMSRCDARGLRIYNHACLHILANVL